jgi:hypothetical protein
MLTGPHSNPRCRLWMISRRQRIPLGILETFVHPPHRRRADEPAEGPGKEPVGRRGRT